MAGGEFQRQGASQLLRMAVLLHLFDRTGGANPGYRVHRTIRVVSAGSAASGRAAETERLVDRKRLRAGSAAGEQLRAAVPDSGNSLAQSEAEAAPACHG